MTISAYQGVGKSTLCVLAGTRSLIKENWKNLRGM